MPESPEIMIPSGLRRLSPAMLAARDRADAFTGVPRGLGKPFRYLAAFQEAEPYLGLPPQAYKLLAWLLKQTRAQDWEEGSRPICWPSAARQAEFLLLSSARVKILNRALFEAGLFILRDSETGKRYGRRDSDGRILEAYGFDLSPLAYRFEEFVRLAAQAKVERERMKALRKRATCARRAILQIGETLAALAPLPPAWPQLVAETAELVARVRPTRQLAHLALVVEGLESRKTQAEAWLREVPNPVDTSPQGLENEPHTIPTNESSDPSDTVTAAEKSSSSAKDDPLPSPPAPVAEGKNAVLGKTLESEPFERVEKLHPSELLELAPRLAAHVSARYPDWRDVVDAAGTALCRELGVSQRLWGESCRTVGRQMAAVTLAVVSTKPPEYFTRGAGGYFAAMVKRAKTGELRLDRTLWKLRRERWSLPVVCAARGVRP